MMKNRFLVDLTWELNNIFRFPFPEILLALFTYMVFTPHPSMFSSTFDLEYLSWERTTYVLAFRSARNGASYSVSAYFPLAILASIFATLSFAYEIENGLLKVYLSHPTSRRAMFLSKFLSCFLIVFTTLSCVLLFFAFLDIPENAYYLILNSQLILRMLLVSAMESFFITSLTVCFSIFSKKASISLIGSFATIYIIQLLGESANLTFLPPSSFYAQVGFLLDLTGPKLSLLPYVLVTPLVSAALAIIAYVYFSRRLELA
jgi:ABC-type transport system involved in multi-copper enzyme maturation permease subunit